MEAIISRTALVILGVVGILLLILLAYHEQILPLLFNSKRKGKKERFLVKLKKSISKIFHHRMKMIKGKIMNLVVQKTILEGKILAVEFYVVIENNNSRYPKQVKIPKEIFAELNRKRKLILEKNILLYFKDYFFKNYFDHYEIA